MLRKTLMVFTLLLVFVCVGCGGASRGGDTVIQASGDVRRGLELAEKKDFAGALAEFQTAYDRSPTHDLKLLVGCVLFQEGDYLGAKSAYEDYLGAQPDAPPSVRSELAAEVRRIDEALAEGLEPQGASLSSRRLRGEVGRYRAEDARESGDFAEAASQYNKASQYISDPELSFETALVATKAEDFEEARRHLKIYFATVGEGLAEDRAARIQAEIDRLERVLAGEEPSAQISLADRVYAERAGQPLQDEIKPVAFTEPSPPPDGGVMEFAEAEGEAPVEGAAEPAEGDADETASAATPETQMTAKEKVAEERRSRAEERRKKKEEQKAKKKAEREARKAKQKSKAEERRKKKEEKKAERQARKAEKKAKAEERRKKKVKAREKKEDPKQESAADESEPQSDNAPPSSDPEQSSAASGADSAEKKTTEVGFKVVTDGAIGPHRPDDRAPEKPTLNVLLTYLKSPSSSVRLKAVKDLVALPDVRATQALEECMLKDSSVQVRLAAVDGLVARKSSRSVPIMRRAVTTAHTSSERARIRRAIRQIVGTE